MGKCLLSRAVLFGAAFFISAAGAAWDFYSESEKIYYTDLDFDARPTGYLGGYQTDYD